MAYTIDQLRSLFEEGSKAGNFASAGYNTVLSPEGEGGGGQTYESVGVNPNAVYIPGGNPKYSTPTLTKLSDEEGGGFRTVTDMLGGANYVTYSPTGEIISEEFRKKPRPSHQDFFRLAGGLAAGVGGLSALAGAAGAGAAGAAGATGGFGITPEMAASLFSGAAPEAAGATVAGGAGTGGVASLGGVGGSGLTAAEMAALNSAAASEVASGASLGAAGSGASAVGAGGTVLPGTAAGTAGAGSSLANSLANGAGKGIVDLLKNPKVLGGLTAAGVGAAAAAAANKGKSEIAPVGLKSIPQYRFDREALPIDTSRKPGVSPAQRYFKDSYTKLAAGGGIAGLPRNEYKAGGRYLSGPGDGMSDNIKANIDGQQEARLADGEFVIPADVVSHIGNGSSNAGAKRLHTMMARIRQARTGNPKQGKQIKPEKYLPA